MFNAYLLRKWHYRYPRGGNQSWVPYVIFGGLPSWIGLIEARLHPALALAVIVPFMPGPDKQALASVGGDEMKLLTEVVMDNITRDIAAQGLSPEQARIVAPVVIMSD